MIKVKNKTVKFILTTAFILLTRAYDLYWTYKYTPDLSREINPLVSVFGMTWLPFLTVISLIILYVIYAYYISLFKPINILPTEEGYTFSNVVAYIYLGYKAEWPAIFYRSPKKLSRVNYYFGHILPLCFIFIGIVSTIMWLLIKYTRYYNSVLSLAILYPILIFGCVAIAYLWTKSQYKKYLQITSKKLPE